MKKATLFLLLISCTKIYSQITIEPEEWVPCQEIKLIFDITVGDCDKLVGSAGPLYLWTWSPADPVVAGGNGSWSSSNELLKLTNEGPNIWSYTMVPTDFYGVSAEEVYADGFKMLVKAKDGGSGGGCGENKTDDYSLTVTPPFTSKKVFLFPQVVFEDDLVSFTYDESLETRTTMQGLSEYYVYAQAYDEDGTGHEVTPWDEVGNNANLKLKNLGGNKYGITAIPRSFFPVPDNKTIISLEFIVRKKVVVDPEEDQVEEVAIFEIGCEAAEGGC